DNVGPNGPNVKIEVRNITELLGKLAQDRHKIRHSLFRKAVRWAEKYNGLDYSITLAIPYGNSDHTHHCCAIQSPVGNAKTDATLIGAGSRRSSRRIDNLNSQHAGGPGLDVALKDLVHAIEINARHVSG